MVQNSPAIDQHAFSRSQPARDVTFLIVEDDDTDIMALERAFHKAQLDNPKVIAHDGVEALEHLRGEAGRDPLPWPYVILLDLNMPRMDGLEFLNTIRADSDLALAPVFVLSTSSADDDRRAACSFQIAGYVEKSNASVDLAELASMLKHYCNVMTFPRSPSRR